MEDALGRVRELHEIQERIIRQRYKQIPNTYLFIDTANSSSYTKRYNNFWYLTTDEKGDYPKMEPLTFDEEMKLLRQMFCEWEEFKQVNNLTGNTNQE